MRRKFLLLPVLLGLALACSFLTSTQPAPEIGEPQIPESEVPRTSLEEAKAAYDNGTAIFVDVRAVSSYEEGHIPGALSIPLTEIERRMGELDPEQWIIPYCT
jgi:3-mercaptopyruvate sulfurtransferase SseA